MAVLNATDITEFVAGCSILECDIANNRLIGGLPMRLPQGVG